MKNKELIMLIGLPGSGKSTWAKNYKEENKNVIIVSSDAIREELGLENTAEHNKICFDEVEKRTIKGMKNGFKVIVDATNLNYKKRMQFLRRVCPKNEEIIAEAVVIATSYENCLKRNSERDRVVPEEVIKRMRESFNFPLFNEGFYDIRIVYNDNTIYRFNEFKDIEQDNPNHTKSVLEHCKMACCIAFDKLCDKEIELACLLHDIGKLETKSFDNKHNDIEIWKDILEFQSRYEISSFGNIKNKKTQKILKPREHSGGYLQVNIINNGKLKNYYVHRLVAKYFCDIPEDIEKKDINHIDGNKKNNFYKNLEFCTRSENIKHSFYTNKNRNKFGEQIWNSKLTLSDIENIKKIKKEQKISNKKISEMYNISESQITRVLNKKTYINKIENKVKEIPPILPQKYATFYNHENVSAYNAMFEENIRKNYFIDEYETIEILQLINWHMLFHRISTEKSINKYTYLLGKDFMDKLRIINVIDNMSR